jgi:hypothetical protein
MYALEDEGFSPGHSLEKTACFDSALDNLQKIVEIERTELQKLD